MSTRITANFTNSSLTFSERNKFTVVGCGDFAWLTSSTPSRNISTGCMAFCSNLEDVVRDQCSGNGCCQSPIPNDINYFYTYTKALGNSNEIRESSTFNPCVYAFVGDAREFKFNGSSDLNDTSFAERIEDSVSLVLDWAIGNLSCPDAKKTRAYACQENSLCVNSTGISGGYRCICNQGYEGNPYLKPGCQDINECKDNNIYTCYGDCVNTLGSYNCTCPRGFVGDARNASGCQHIVGPRISPALYVIIAFEPQYSLESSFVFGMKKRNLMMLREKYFEQNGGVLLKQKNNVQGAHEAMTLFSPEDLLKATNGYSQEHIIGRGAYGVVYKGVLSDMRVVAVKKSKVVDATQAEQFINEVLILTQVIHRNVVKLLGCCLEEEVPILVYEFISNNTLFHHIHYRQGGMSWLSWEHRLRIAVEAASALAYLHSETIMPIVHRDVKSSNILLDSKYTVKISDFGASRLVPLDHEQVTTLIQGTLGYLDPEYYHTSELTEKSDVYSFGVVLAELITGKRPIGVDRANKEKNLATYFVNSVNENRLYTILEPRILREGSLDQLQAVGDLVKRCLNLQGGDRPTMKEVAVELDGLRKATTHPWVQQKFSGKTTSQVLEVEQHDLYEDVPLVSFGTNECESYSATYMTFEEGSPR
ncbi:putative wall-associated receptor kinase-like 16 [Bidens hawaiensis]|uniref:putative wall-associated receptor kinase-like 16 n=1 Tax=Bidens hawaiensis TaxID=980011 RepID=UPI00404941D0